MFFYPLVLGGFEFTQHMFGLRNPVGESFQDYSWIQDFEADFPQKVSLKMLN